MPMKYTLQIFPVCEVLHMGYTGSGDEPENASELCSWLKWRYENWSEPYKMSHNYDLAVRGLILATLAERGIEVAS